MQHPPQSAVIVLAFLLCMLMAAAAPIASSSGGRYTMRLTKAENYGVRVLDRSNNTLELYSLTSLCALPPFTYPSFLNMSRIDSQTGLAVTTVYQTGESCQLSQPVAPVADPRTKRIFMCAYHRTSWFELWGEPVLIIFDMSKSDGAVPQQRIPLPTSPDMLLVFFYSGQVYDAAANNVWVVAQSFELGTPSADVVFLIKVDLNKGVAYNITTLPNIPAKVQGAEGVFNTKTRKLILSLHSQVINDNQIAEFDVDTSSFTRTTSSIYRALSMVRDDTTGNTYGILATTQVPGLSYGVLQSSTGNWRILQSYPNVQGAGKMVVDHAAGLLYGELSGGNFRQFVAINITTGTLLRAANLPENAIDLRAIFGM